MNRPLTFTLGFLAGSLLQHLADSLTGTPTRPLAYVPPAPADLGEGDAGAGQREGSLPGAPASEPSREGER